MYHFLFLGSLAACLSWTACCTAAAVRCERPWLRRLLLVVGLLAPLVALLPWLAASTMLAFIANLEVNWFGPTVTLFLSALIGGGWIQRAGTQPRGGGWKTVPAADWPVVSLLILFLVTKTVTAGSFLFLDQAVQAEAAFLKTEAAALMAAEVPPVVPSDDNAAELYRAASTLVEGEDFSSISLDEPLSEATTDLLIRQADTLDLVRQATTRGVCRFERDWSRPSFSMLLHEIHHLRTFARLLSLAARQAASEGRLADAIADIHSLNTLSRHAASEPIIISGLVGLALDRMAIDTLIATLPFFKAADLGLLDDEHITDMLLITPSLQRHFYGEEAFGIRAFAELAGGTLADRSESVLHELTDFDATRTTPLLLDPALMAFRVFLFPQELNAYRKAMHFQQDVLASPDTVREKQENVAAYLERFQTHPPGILSAAILPSFESVFVALGRSEAHHRAALVAIASLRMRLEQSTQPETILSLVPTYLPRSPKDPFDPGQNLKMKQVDEDLLIYSVGPNGTDDGGPTAETDQGGQSDDVGVRLLMAP